MFGSRTKQQEIRQEMLKILDWHKIQQNNDPTKGLTKRTLRHQIFLQNTPVTQTQFNNFKQLTERNAAFGDDRHIHLFTYMSNKPIHLLYIQTSQTKLDWKTFKWRGEMLQNHKWNTPQHAFGPLNMLAHLQTYTNNILRGNHFDVLFDVLF